MGKLATLAFEQATLRQARLRGRVSSKLASASNPKAVARRTPKPQQFQPVAPGGAFRAQPGVRKVANSAIRRGRGR